MIRKTLVRNQPEVGNFVGKLRIFAEFITLSFVIAAVLCNYQDAMSTTGYAYAQTPNPQTLPPGRLEVFLKLRYCWMCCPSHQTRINCFHPQNYQISRFYSKMTLMPDFGLIALTLLAVQFSKQNSLPPVL